MIEFIGLICATFLFAKGAEPVQMLKRLARLDTDAEPANGVHKFFIDLLNCSLCCGFWFGLFFYKALLMACIVSVCAEVLTRILHRI